MKKIIFLLLGFLAPLSGVSALSYNGVPGYAYPSFVKDGQLYSSALVGHAPCAYFNQAWGCSMFQPNNPGFFSMGRSPYYYHTPGELGFGENYKYIMQNIIEIDLSNTPSGSGARIVDGGCNQDQYCYDLYLSGSQLKYRLWYLNTTEPNFIYIHMWEIPQLVGDWKDVSFGGYAPKKIVLGFRQYFYSYNNVLGSKSYLQKLSMQRITDTSRSAYVDFTQSGSVDGVLLTNTFSAPGFDGTPFVMQYSNSNSFLNKVNGYVTANPSLKSSFPYWRDTIEVTYSPGAYYPYYGNMLMFPNIDYYSFGDLTTRIRSSSGSSDSWNYNDENFISSFYDIDNALANFYVSTGSTIYGYQWNGASSGGDSGSSGGGSSSGGTIDYFASCTSWTDVGCYVQGMTQSISATLDSFSIPTLSDIWSFFVPEINFNGMSETCYNTSGSGTITPSIVSSSGVTSSLIQKFSNLFIVLVPVAPANFSEVCTFDGVKQIEYASTDPNVIDILLVLFAFVPVLLTAKPHHD